MGEAKLRGNRTERIDGILAQYGVKPISKERFNAYVAWTRSPVVSFYGKELEYFANSTETLLGVLILDRTDRDFGFVALGRDLKRRFRCVDVNASMTKTGARHALFQSMQRLTDSRKDLFPQLDEDSDHAGVDLYTSLVPDEKLHFAFKLLKDGPPWTPARALISEMMNHFIDVDGNFAEQFQTTAFDSRIWELYLYAALLELGLFVSREHEAPDFEVQRGGRKVFIEAVTVGPSPKDPAREKDEDGRPKQRTPEEVKALLKSRVPIRFGSALYSKLSRKAPKVPYWELEHVKNHPLVFAVADFHEDQSMTWTSPALLEYLYGVTHDFTYNEAGQLIITPLRLETHEYNGKQIPSGFFLQENAEHISAVLFSSSGTISKFNRMGLLAGFGSPGQRMFRFGVKHKHDPNAALPEPFFVEVTQGTYVESWADGLSMFHNPKAQTPIDPSLFPGIAHHFFVDGQIRSILPEFHPYSSLTWNIHPRDEGAGDAAEIASQAAAQ